MKKIFSKLTLCTVVLILASFIPVSCVPTGGGLEQRNCVVMIGDSIFALSGAIERHLRTYSHQKYRTYYMSATQMQGGVNDIESQLDTALRMGRIRTVIMDGGGNDFLIGGGFVAPQAVITEINNAYERVFRKAAQAGVENVVVMGYYKTGTTSAITDQSESDVRRITLEAAQKYGLNTAHFDPSDDPWFSSKRPGQYTIMDGIHPTDAAANQLARLIWQTMQANDIEQGPGCQGF